MELSCSLGCKPILSLRSRPWHLLVFPSPATPKTSLTPAQGHFFPFSLIPSTTLTCFHLCLVLLLQKAESWCPVAGSRM